MQESLKMLVMTLGVIVGFAGGTLLAIPLIRRTTHNMLHVGGKDAVDSVAFIDPNCRQCTRRSK